MNYLKERKALQLCFHAIWYVLSQKTGVSALGLQKALELSSLPGPWLGLAS